MELFNTRKELPDIMKYCKQVFVREEGHMYDNHYWIVVYFLFIWAAIINRSPLTTRLDLRISLPIEIIGSVIFCMIGIILCASADNIFEFSEGIYDKCLTFVQKQFKKDHEDIINIFLRLTEFCLFILFLYILFQVLVNIGVYLITYFLYK